jgi:hypothetical protein
LKFVPIFAHPEGRLFSVWYDDAFDDIFSTLFQQWQDPEYLFSFFMEHHADLQGSFYKWSVQEAVIATRNEAVIFRDQIISTVDTESMINANVIDSLFKELSPSEFILRNHRKQKAYGPVHSSWLRIYAIKVQDCFLITGGAIKLTGAMKDRRHTRLELNKLEQVKNKLIDLGIYDRDGLKE